VEETFTGKMLVRKTKTNDGRSVVILCGIFKPGMFNVSLHDNDEMWTCKIAVTDVIKRKNASDTNLSPEDFLENVHGSQLPGFWIGEKKK